MILGVCGGVGDYFNIDPTLVRLIWLVLSICTFIFGGIVCYILAAIIIPEE
jgi:phage shock protein PspC (stress-responsive transcriptional regulator)